MNDNEVVLNSKIWVNKSYFNDSEYYELKKLLTIRPKKIGNYGNNKNPDPIQLYSEVNGMISIPRYLGILKYKNTGTILDRTVDERGLVKFDFKAKLWDTQEYPANKIVKHLLESDTHGGILRSPCGSGKSVMAMYTLAAISAPTMIIVHDNGLLEQWINEVQKFLGLSLDDIGIVKQDKCIFKGKKIVFALAQSLHARENRYPVELYSYPTLVIYDEVHRTGARTFCSWMNNVRAKYRLGLSATPRRLDGAEDVFFWHIGPVVAEGVANNMNPEIFRIYLPKLIEDIKNSNGMVIKPIMVSRLAGTRTPKGKTEAIAAPNRISIIRNMYISDDIIKALKSGRKVLVLSNRIAQMEQIEKYILSRIEIDTGWYIGGMGAKEKAKGKKKNLIFATYKLGSEGMDIPDLDTVVFATPVSDVEQSIGRALRYCEGKKVPYILDYIDGNDCFTRMGRTRNDFYKSMGYKCTSIIRS